MVLYRPPTSEYTVKPQDTNLIGHGIGPRPTRRESLIRSLPYLIVHTKRYGGEMKKSNVRLETWKEDTKGKISRRLIRLDYILNNN